jgi:squalene-associated FAD-dependent desaturase
MTGATAIVVGGGLAGISAAVRLADAGVPVTLLEASRRLGGRAGSFHDRRTGLEIDNCQHVTLGCCTRYRALLDHLGAGGSLRWTREQWWVEPGGRTSVLAPSVLPAPVHAAPSFLRARFLGWSDKRAIARAFAAIGVTDRTKWRARTFADFLTAHRQPEQAVRRFWSPVIVSACNLGVEQVSAEPALQVFQDGLLRSAEAGFIGVPTRPLSRLYDAAMPIIRGAGGHVRLGARAATIGERTVELSSGDVLEADRVICALPLEAARKAIDPELAARDGRLPAVSGIWHSPILGVHLVFDRPVLETPHAVLLDTGTHWAFRKDEAGKVIHAVVSAGDTWMDLPEAEIVRRVRADLALCFPRTRDARVVSGRAVKERRATFAATPDAEEVRPEVSSDRSALVLAGDWVRTGWPATMEGATRAGEDAADAVLARA